MGTLITNKMITRGFGVARSVVSRNGLIAQGLCGVTRNASLETVSRPRVKQGQSGFKRHQCELSDILIAAKLVQHNNINYSTPKIRGFVRRQVDVIHKTIVTIEHAGTQIRAPSSVKFIIRRVK